MKNLIAYIPTVNQRHIDWFAKHEGINTNLFLISQKDAEKLLPRLERNLAAVPTDMMVRMLRAEFTKFGRVTIFSEDWLGAYPNLSDPDFKDWILADEDVSYLFAEKHLLIAGCNVYYEMIWARWDMKAVISSQPVIEDVRVTESEFDTEIMAKARAKINKSSDWWRQIGVVLITHSGTITVSSFNEHMPNEYETYIFGDPGINRDAGEVGKYTSIHAEESAIALCARDGISTRNGSIYVTTFPCEKCARLFKKAGIKKLFFHEGYSSLNAQEVLKSGRVEIYRVV